MSRNRTAAYRASLLHCVAEPAATGGDAAVEYFEDGLLVIANGHVEQAGPASQLLPGLPANVPINDYRGKLIVPGLIDCHVHYPQIDMIAAYGEQLLEWLERYAYPAERRFVDAEYAADAANFFVEQLLSNGTTTALVFATVHPQSVDAIFTAAEKRNMRA